MLTGSLRDLVKAATAHAVNDKDSGDRTVATALLTRSGRTVRGLSTYHVPGGRCEESLALSTHAATCPGDPISAITAVHGTTGRVISPGGNCRQELFELDPSIRCVVRDSSGLKAVPAQIVFEKEYGEVVTIDATVTSVVETSYRELTVEQARRDGFASLAELHQTLNIHYPDLTGDDMTDVVSVEIGSNDGNGSVRSRP